MNQATNITGRTPARAELAAHLSRLRKASADAEEANRPLQRVLAQVQKAEASHAAAESALSAIDESEAASVRKHVASGVWPIPELSREQRESRSDAEAAVATARRAASTVRQNSVIAQTKYDQVSQAVAELAQQTAGRIDRVLADEADAALSDLRASLSAAADAMQAVSSISAHLVERGDLRSAERINIAINTMARPDQKAADTSPVRKLALALQENADAT